MDDATGVVVRERLLQVLDRDRASTPDCYRLTTMGRWR